MNVLHALARRERVILLSGAFLVTLLAWIELARRAAPMDATMVPHHVGAAVAMWSVMMVAMMLPSAIPALLIFHMAQKGRMEARALAARAAVFGAGYLAVWFAWSFLAAVLQGQLQHHALLSGRLAVASPLLAASFLAVAGAYQFTRWKHACLTQCQAPQDFLVLNWRNGWRGAFAMGAHHGIYCAGCCWALMAVLFVVGIMNLAWVGALAAVVFVEKAVAGGPVVSRAVGAFLLAWAAYVGYVGFAG